MAATTRPRRSVLYMPGSNARALEKGRTLRVDGLILDLEDAVAPDSKELARTQICDAVKAGGYGMREILIRTNGLNTTWGYDDIVAASTSGADGILLPKVDSADMVRQVEAIMDAAGAPTDMKIWCMMETPRAMLRAEEIADSTDRMGGFVMGTSDLAKDLRCAHTAMRLPFMMSLNICVLAARAANIAILDGVYLDLSDDEGFVAHCTQGFELGFDGKTLIHPKTVAVANEIFGPSEAEVAWSHKIIAAHAEAEAEGKGVVVVDGKLIENLHVVTAKQVVAQAEAIEKMSAAE